MSAVLDARIAPTDDSTASADLELRQLMQGGSRTFFAASLLLPARIRAQATALYAFCRIADDEIDFGLDKPAALDALRKRLDGIYGGRPIDCAADRALCRVVQDTGLPRALLDGLLEGFLWDAEERQYETLAEVQAYGARVAGTVGAMMAIVMQTRSPDALARACELGVAMQLTNIARDVGEDARAGRLYLPRQWLREAGIDPEAWLRAPVFNAAIASVTGRLLDAADELYRRADAGIAALPRDCRVAIRAAQIVYAEIGEQLRRQGLDSIHHRAVVSGARKLVLVARASAVWFKAPQALTPAPGPLPAVAWLVDAALASRPGSASRSMVAGPVPARSFDEKMLWATDLWARLAEQDQRPR
ncbi:MAG: phytoene/squalene synthase family protein [Burkholderiaceae bacterium]